MRSPNHRKPGSEPARRNGAGETTREDMAMSMKRSTSRRSGGERGYSLPELLIVIALIGIFVVFGGPSINEAYKAYKIWSVANELVTDLRAQRYNAVSNRAPRTLTLNNQSATPPNQYSYTTYKGVAMTVRLENSNIETTSAASVTFNTNGSTGAVGNQTVVVSGNINDTRNDRYTI